MRIRRLGLFLTKRCNFNCVYCCAAKGEDPSDKLSLKEIKGLLLQSRKMGAKSVLVAGEGEPFLDENLFPLIEYAASLDMSFTVTTNGSRIDKQIARWLYDHRVRLFVKLDSLQPAVHNKLYGTEDRYRWVDYVVNGATFRIPECLKDLLTAGYQNHCRRFLRKHLLAVAMVITRLNLESIPEVVKFCRLCGIGIYMEKLLPVRPVTLLSDIIPSSSEITNLYSIVSHLMDHESKSWLKVRCAFETDPFIDVSGNIRFCFGIDRNVGNIRQMLLKVLHREMLNIKDQCSSISPFFNFGISGFRHCRARRLLEDEQ